MASEVGHGPIGNFFSDASNLPTQAIGSSALRVLSRRFADFIDAADFGAVPDGTTDSTQAFLDIGTYMRANPGTKVKFHKGTGAYLYQKNWWLIGVTNGEILGEPGTKFKNSKPNVGGGDIQYVGLVMNYDCWVDVDPTLPNPWAAGSSTTSSYYLINTVAARSSTVTTSTAADAGNFSAGDWLLVYGYNIYPGGWPPSAGFCDYAKVVSAVASTGVITIDRPLRNNYDSRWYDATSGGNFTGGTVPIGAPRVVKLTRSIFKFADYLKMENIDFLPGNYNPNGYNHGTLYVIAADRVDLIKVTASGIDPSECDRVVFRDCDIEAIEVDKDLCRVDFQDCRLSAGVYGASGSDRTVFRGCELRGTFEVWGNSLLIDDCESYCTSGLDQMMKPHARDIVIRDLRIHSSTSDAASLRPLASGDVAYSLTVVAAGSNWFTVSQANSNLLKLRPGTLVYKDSGGGWGTDISDSAWVTAVYYDGANAKIELGENFRTTIAGGDVLYFWEIQHYLIDNVRMVDQSGRYLPFPLYQQVRAQTYMNVLESSRSFYRTSFTFKNAQVVRAEGGFPCRVLFMVEKASVGATKFQFAGQTVDTTVIGAREATSTDTSGAKAGDALAILTFAGTNDISPAWSAGVPGTYPEGFVIVEIARRL